MEDSIADAIRFLERNPRGVRFAALSKTLQMWFGEPRTKGSHCIFRTPWQGDPRLNIQDANGKAKAYQVRQAIQALRRLSEQGDDGTEDTTP